MNDEEKRKYEAFQYWIQTNTERGVTAIPDNLCLFVVNLIEKLQKENEELRKKLNEENKRCMMLAIEKQDYFEKYRYHLQQNERLTKEFSNVILVQKVKDKIIHYQELQNNYIEKYDEISENIQSMINVLQVLLEEGGNK